MRCFKLCIILTLVSLSGCVNKETQSENTYSQVLEAELLEKYSETEMMKGYFNETGVGFSDLNSTEVLHFLDDVFEENRFILVGETHYININPELQNMFLKFLSSNQSNYTMVMERSYFFTLMINKYLSSGDIKYLDSAYNPYFEYLDSVDFKLGLTQCKKEYDTWKEMRDYYSESPDKNIILVHGIEGNWHYKETLKYLVDFLEENKVDQYQVEELDFLFYIDFSKKFDDVQEETLYYHNHIIENAISVKSIVDSDEAKMKELFGDESVEMRFLFESLYDICNRNHLKDREGFLFENVKEMLEHPEIEKCLFWYGANHTLQNTLKVGTIDSSLGTLGTRIKNRYTEDGVYSILLQYPGVFTYFEDSERLFLNGVGEFEYKIYRLDLYPSIFGSKDRDDYNLYEEGTVYSIEYPEELGVIDKFQAILIIKSSSWSDEH